MRGLKALASLCICPDSYGALVQGLIVQSVGSPTAYPGVASLIPAWSLTFVEIDHEIISTGILLPLIQEGLLSVTRESLCTKYMYWLND